MQKRYAPSQIKKRKRQGQQPKRSKSKSVARYPMGEVKYNDQDKGQTTVANTGTVLQNTLPGFITVGTGESERIGRKVTVTSVMLRGRIILPSTSTVGDTTDVVRLIIYIDHQTNGAAATVANILKSASINSFRNLDNTSRFDILHDESYELSSNGGAGNGTSDDYVEAVRYIQIYKKCNLPIEYQAGAGTVTDLTQNNIGILGIAQSGLANIKFTTRLRYSDK